MSSPVAKVSRVEVRQRQTRIRLREVTYALMADQPIEAITIQQITDAADIGFGTFYNYFATKEALALEVLDCVIHDIGERNDVATEHLGETDPVRIVANSVRFVIRDMVTNPIWRWWMTRADLLVERSRVGFGPFGLRDIERAAGVGAYHLIDANASLAWSHLCWLMVAGAKDILDGYAAPGDERSMVEAILRVNGVDHDHAHAACSTDLPLSPDRPIDFAFELT